MTGVRRHQAFTVVYDRFSVLEVDEGRDRSDRDVRDLVDVHVEEADVAVGQAGLDLLKAGDDLGRNLVQLLVWKTHFLFKYILALVLENFFFKKNSGSVSVSRINESLIFTLTGKL